MEIIKNIKSEIKTNTNCINFNGGDDQYDEGTGAGVNCGGSVTD